MTTGGTAVLTNEDGLCVRPRRSFVMLSSLSFFSLSLLFSFHCLYVVGWCVMSVVVYLLHYTQSTRKLTVSSHTSRSL